ncbi:MAG: glycosyltransferase family 4 protein [Cyclobacteriaceae bacterium]
MPDLKFIVSLLTARRNYDVAKVLYNNGLLDSLFTDLYYAPTHKVFKTLDKIAPHKLTKTYKRYNSPLPDNIVHYDWPLGLEFRYKLKKNTNGAYYKTQIDAYKRLNRKVIEYGMADQTKKNLAFFGFDTACLEVFNWGASKDYHLVMEQCVAPRQTQIRMHEHFASMNIIESKHMVEHCLHLQEREEQEWQLASTIIAPSSFVRNELIEAGASAEKIKIVPFGFDPTNPVHLAEQCVESRFTNRSRAVQILFAGNAGYRKGIYDLLAIAQEMSGENVQFVIAGSIEEDCQKAISSLNLSNVSFLGKLSQADLHEEYRKSDIFFFPSYLEGSAMVIFEAMSWGVPVITTNESGSVIQHEYDGFICSAGHQDKMKELLDKLIYDTDLRYEIGKNALNTSRQYTLTHYSNRLISELTNQPSYA